ncbi:dsDNA nuclease domain-containing protein [Streptomyces sp. NPDC001792]|uniref:dsDNA nuclease domain-containing protein n=1 Tax=Streptomyces sp. NPDC001792 TaxID=3154524 RepID=UPI00332FD560
MDTDAPDDSGSVSGERFEYQVHATLRSVLQMPAGAGVLHVTCEHIEDIVVATTPPGAPNGDTHGDFQQIKTRESPGPWGLSAVLDAKPLASLWRTHKAVRDLGLTYRLTAGLEGLLDPGDENVQALARRRGAEKEARVKRIARRVKITPEEAATFRGGLESGSTRGVTEAEAASPLAHVPYSLRHAGVSRTRPLSTK